MCICNFLLIAINQQNWKSAIDQIDYMESNKSFQKFFSFNSKFIDHIKELKEIIIIYNHFSSSTAGATIEENPLKDLRDALLSTQEDQKKLR